MIKATIQSEGAASSEKKFPKLIKAGDRICLAISKTQVLHLTGIYAGVFSSDWNWDQDIRDYNEPITLQNA